MDPAFHPDNVRVPWWSKPLASLMSKGTRPQTDGRDERDYAGYDMQIDRALALNRRITTLPGVYYFSVPCSYTRQEKDGAHRPRKKMEPLFVMRACQIGAYSGTTRGGMRIDASWRENDGLVNTFSAAAPLSAPAVPLDKNRIRPGIWNVFPTYEGDHMALQGGLMRKHDVRIFYLDLLQMICTLEA
jgi:triacylglycerol lipase